MLIIYLNFIVNVFACLKSTFNHWQFRDTVYTLQRDAGAILFNFSRHLEQVTFGVSGNAFFIVFN